MKSLVLSLFFLSLGQPLFAQNSIDLFTVAWQYGFPQHYENNLPQKARDDFWNVNLKVPIVLSETNTWYNEISYYNFHIKGDDELPVAVNNPANLHGIIMQTGLMHRFNEKDAMILLFVPRLMGDLRHHNPKNFQFGGIALFERKINTSLTMRFGASFNRELFGPFVVPLIYLNWRLSDKWYIAGLLPVYSKINYRLNDDVTLGFHHFGLVTTYHLSTENAFNDYMERRSIDFSLFARFRVAGNVHFELRTGVALGKDYLQYGDGDKVDFGLPLINFGDNRVQKNVSFNGGPFIRGQLVYNLVLP
ncbi:DUF6268 family outer membrane beta-barrel protein [Fulvivirgaceae bacterium BMA12]|uniref:DUF6268 family outer membrane beta-barrel protein n=1 Tax=Agaribacillus aureus TaxID=3051825 RepID=A0ABT8L8T4_9BACT|nr:DUF6268 family outer membrane beta-barrel protein [Fulvivirgaceae bacterium BMA12]